MPFSLAPRTASRRPSAQPARLRREHGRRLRAELETYRSASQSTELAAMVSRHSAEERAALADLTGLRTLAV